MINSLLNLRTQEKATYIIMLTHAILSRLLYPVPSDIHPLAVAGLTSLTKIRHMRPIVTHFLIRWRHNLDPRPLLQSIHNPVRIRLVQLRLRKPVALFASLMVHPGVVLLPGVHSNGDGDELAGPSPGGALLVVAGEAAHDVGVVVLGAVSLVVVVVEGEDEVALPQ